MQIDVIPIESYFDGYRNRDQIKNEINIIRTHLGIFLPKYFEFVIEVLL